MNNIDFGEWMKVELAKRQLSQTDLAQLVGVTPAHISRILSGARGADPELLVNIARILKLSPIQVFRAAGLLPPASSQTTSIEELDEIMKNANEDERAEILRYARYILRDRKVTNPKTAET